MEVGSKQQVAKTAFFPVWRRLPVGGGRKTRVTHDSNIIVKQRVLLGDGRRDSGGLIATTHHHDALAGAWRQLHVLARLWHA